ncbi:HlyD family type I secretion periplasmic adaptor subunit [Anderseniella sp. Alg231-50]|uniref:HlyD family type I secretion periplasmic adaptor subunit n=1 Tax=Anderseniella sp. Alg231-50 TaxID=1922226 RepID=UPI000D55258A
MRYHEEDLEFAREYEAALHQGPPRRTTLFLVAILMLFAAFLGWAYWAQLDEVARGDGRVVPTGKNQVVQSLEGGIVEEIMMREGAIVQKGDLLLRIDDTGFASNLGELQAKKASLEAQIYRLQLESAGEFSNGIKFPIEMVKASPRTVAAEEELFNARRRSLDGQVAVLRERVKQRQQELREVEVNVKRLTETLELARQEEKLKAPLARSGVVPKTDLIRLQREIADIGGQLQGAEQSRPRLEAAIREAEALQQDQMLTMQQKSRSEMSDKIAELAIVNQSLTGASDKVERTEIRAPVPGIVNKLNVNTIGGVVSAGQVLVEIVPQEESLLVEARIRPSDIAFIHPGQKALVKITAYDFSIFGGLDGTVEQISADSAIDEATREVYYTVTVKTLSNKLDSEKNKLSIFPGMVASVDVITGKKSVLQYLLKPINKAWAEALRER